MSEFSVGTYVRKKSGAFWEGSVVGHYSTQQTPDGISVQLFGWSDGPVQIYPAAALELCDHSKNRLPPPPSPHVAPVRLKPLEWRTLVCSDRHAEVADSVLGRWEMWSFPNGSTHIMKPGEHQGSVYEDTPEEAKAYLERVYQRRMAPALASAEGSTDAE